ncbi:iron-sulfur cluster assembly scaffold protein [uncultured Parasphingorhabdus sp.]|uniref:iron-sulfur cluster assembly scaffold protein n=1 Tax=uncultured Parasphingorhabdus sp. TaxID=2709694 RepID=UPI0030DA72C2|tara:strand:+ start:23905 stop:24342 length:438 start_codon:yes stop_codon:yes gene_type:complete
MSEALYTRDILRLAVSIPHQERLDSPDGSAEIRSRTCGSVVAADVILADDGALVDLGMSISACALGQASASILGTEAIGLSLIDIVQAKSGLEEFFSGKAESPGDWQNMDKLVAARDHKGRHAAILLPYDALIAAFANAAKRKTT